ncbi:MAG: hypothetical protein ACLFRR_07365 [Spirochaetaceae bacterium]
MNRAPFMSKYTFLFELSEATEHRHLSGSLLRIPFFAMVDPDGGRTPFLILLITSVVGVAGVWAIITFGEGMLRELFPLGHRTGFPGGRRAARSAPTRGSETLLRACLRSFSG